MEEIIEIYKPAKLSNYELESCPFCGSKEIVYVKYLHLCGCERWRIMCCGCCAEVDPGYAQTKFSVQALWNRRVKK